MGTLRQIAVLLTAALVAAHPLECPTTAIVTVTILEQQIIIVQEPQTRPWHNVVTSSRIFSESQATRQSYTTTKPRSSGESYDFNLSHTTTTSRPFLDEYMTIAMTNVHGASLSIFFDSNVDGPPPIEDPSATTLAHGSLTQYAFPTGWGGRIYVGPNLNPLGSKIEGSYVDSPDIDISYVDGYSVPITCSSAGTAIAGCNIDLFSQPGISCDDQVDGPVCINPARWRPNGPPSPFFVACQGAAYTYPNDNKANVSNLQNRLVTCCIGTTCEAPLRQKHNQTIMTHRKASRRDESRSRLPYLP